MDFLSPVLNIFRDFIDAVYWAGVAHGAFVASLCWLILIALIAAIAIAVYFGKQRHLIVTLLVAVLGIALWWGSRLPLPKPAPAPVITPEKPVKPWWRPFKEQVKDVEEA